MKKALQVASVASMIDQFTMPNINILQELGYEVDVVANFEFGSTSSKERVEEFQKELKDVNVNVFNLLFNRKIFDKCNIQVYKQLKKIIDENDYEIIHCHSPIGGVITRLAARRARKKGTKVIYTAHGFHFYKGSSLVNWLIYYPVEWICSWFTDVLITINKEDYSLAQKRMKAKQISYIPGVGIETDRFKQIVDRVEKRKSLDINKDEVMLFSVGELNKNKNHQIIIKAISRLNNPKVKYYIAGKGDLESDLKEEIGKLNLDKQVYLLGFRNDIAELSKAADIFCFPSYREGLSVALMEILAAGVPVVCSNIRGNKDLVHQKKGGYLCNVENVDDYVEALNILIKDSNLRESMRKYNLIRSNDYDVKIVNKSMKQIYQGVVNE
ncbi:MAG: glycosyltransferase family 4 protein [Zhenhengia sp.]|uniref:glycosyltransferase family 4 protein n=1 Tax=Zhenhengia sp. TaxID=2944208 RepID=UPI00399608AF